jgi:predicted MFS family arabinose efflux permease
VFGALASRSFVVLCLGNLLSNTGSWMQQVAEPWLVLRLSSSPTLLGLDSFAADAPVWLLILAGGVLADRSDRRRTAILFQGIQFLCPALLVVLLLTGHARVSVVIALSFVVGITDALSMPSVQSLVPSSVEEDLVPSAIALNSAQFNLSRVLGPLFAGVIMSTIGAVACFAFNAASYVPFLVAIALVRLAPVTNEVARPRDAMREVLHEAVHRAVLRRALLTVVASSLFCAPIITFVPVLVRDAFRLGADAFGGALAVFGVGGLGGAGLVLLTKRPRSRQALSSFAALGLGALVAGVALASDYAVALPLLFFVGVAMVATNTAVNTILQSAIDARLRGRVSSLYTLAVRGGAPLGNLATGLVASHYGVRTALLADGILAVACQLALTTALRRADRAER